MSNLIYKVLKRGYRILPASFRDTTESLFAPILLKYVKTRLDWEPPLNFSRRPISIVIPSYNDVKLLKTLIKSLRETLTNFTYEIIISDDFCESENLSQLQKFSTDNIRVVSAPERTGFSGAVNRGIAVSQWDVVLLNSDIIALPGWADWLQYSAYEIDPKIGMVSPHLLYPTGKIQYAGTFHLRTIAPQWFSHLHQGRLGNYKPAQFEKYIRSISGAAVYVKREVLKKIGFLDDEFWLGFEDVDWGYSAWKAGYRCFIQPRARLIHLESATRGFKQGPKEYASLRRFWDKWQIEATPIPASSYIFAISSEATNTLKLAVNSVISELIKCGLNAQIVKLKSLQNHGVDEDFINSYSGNTFQLIACDADSMNTVWLASVSARSPIALIPDLYSANLLQFKGIFESILKPEFIFITFSELAKYQLQLEIPWKVDLLTFPICSNSSTIGAKNKVTGSRALVVCSEDKKESSLITKLEALGIETEQLSNDSEEFTEQLLYSSNQPDYLIDLITEHENFEALSMMAHGTIPFISSASVKNHIFLDGFNCFISEPTNESHIISLIENLEKDKANKSQMMQNALYTSSNTEATFIEEFRHIQRASQLEILPKRT